MNSLHDKVYKEALFNAIADIGPEIFRSKTKHPSDFVNGHEAYAVLQEEIEELWADVKTDLHIIDPAHSRNECIQIAAMAIRFAVEVCDVNAKRKNNINT